MLCRTPALPEDSTDAHQRLLASALHLMSAYVRRTPEGCALLADVISRHLEDIARSPDSNAILRATCSDLADNWRARAVVPMACPRNPWWGPLIDKR